jgi:hypothetical protein
VRTKDLAGRPVDTAVTHPGGINGVGFEGLRNFIRDHRQDQFINNLCRKLLTYGLNRTLQFVLVADGSLRRETGAVRRFPNAARAALGRIVNIGIPGGVMFPYLPL